MFLVQLVPDNYEGLDLKPVTSNELITNAVIDKDKITRNLRKIRLQFQYRQLRCLTRESITDTAGRRP